MATFDHTSSPKHLFFDQSDENEAKNSIWNEEQEESKK